MTRTLRAAALSFAMLAPTALAAQTHVVGLVGGLGVTKGTWKHGIEMSGPLLDMGASSTIELNKLISVGTEARYVMKSVSLLSLGYVETPLFVRIADPRSDAGPQAFVRLGVAPAFEIQCAGAPDPGTSPMLQRALTGIVGFSYHPLAKQRNLEQKVNCDRLRDHKLDVGTLVAIGLSGRSDRDQFAVEIRATLGMRDLNGPYVAPIRNRHIALLLSTGTRLF